MQFLYSSASEIEEGFPKVRVVTEDLLEANLLYNQAVQKLDESGGSKTCCRCSKRAPNRVFLIQIIEDSFSCALPMAVCDRCSRSYPFVTQEAPRNYWQLWLAVVVSVLLISTMKPELMLLGIVLALVSIAFRRSKPKPREDRTLLAKKMVSESPFFSKFAGTFPNAHYYYRDVNGFSAWRSGEEKSQFQSSLVPFDRGFVLCDMHGMTDEDGSGPICNAVFDYLHKSLHERLRLANDSPMACQALITFFPGRRRVIQTQILPKSTRQQRVAFEKGIDEMPEFPVRAPIVVLYRSSNLAGARLGQELTIPDVNEEFRRYIRAMTMDAVLEDRHPEDLADQKKEDFESPSKDASNGSDSRGLEDIAFARKMMEDPRNEIELADLENWRNSVPRNKNLVLGIPDFLASKGLFEEADASWNASLEKEGNEPDLLFTYARFLERNDRAEKAASICQSMIRDPKSGTEWYGYLAHLQHVMGFPEQAQKTILETPPGPRSSDFHFVAANIAEALGDISGGIKELDLGLQENPEHTGSILLRSKLSVIQQDYERALQNVDRYLELEGPSLRAIQLKAYILDRKEGGEKSIEYLSKCIDTYGDHPFIRGLRAEAYRDSGKFALALEDCDWIVAHNPELQMARQQRAEIRLENGDIDGAIADSQYLLDNGIENAGLLSELGYARLVKEEHDLAIELLQRSVGLDPTNVGARYRLSQAYSKTGRIEEAIAELTAVLEIDQEHAIPYIVRGYHYLMRGDHEEAGRDFEAALKLEPREVQALRGRALVFELRGDRKEALKYLDEALGIDPENEECLLDRSRLSFSGYDLKSAEKDLNLLIQSSPNLLAALFSRAQLHMQMGHMEQALKDLDSILKQDPDFAPALIGRSAIYEQQGDQEKSQEDLDAAVRLQPESAEETEFQRAIMSAHIASIQLRFDEAIEAASRAIEIDPANEQGYLRRASAFWRSDQFADAWEDYNHVIEILAMDLPAAFIGRGGCSAELGEFESALQDLDHALGDIPKNDTSNIAACLSNKARALIGVGKLADAEQALTESMELQPWNGWTFFNRALLHLAKKEEALAVADFKKAIEIDERPLPPGKKAKAMAYVMKFDNPKNESSHQGNNT